VGDPVAFTHCLARISGAARTGTERAYWVRWTACFRKFDGIWFIMHDQVSVPLDFKSGRALLDLEP
jgi:ketosteroid isomerase-like protein